MPDYDDLAGIYDATRGGEERGRELAPWLSELLPVKGPILDLGAGTGLLAAALVELGRDVVGIDPSAEMLAVARRRVSCELIEGDATHVPFPDGSFDSVLAALLFQLIDGRNGEHLPFLAEAARVLRPDGRLVITPVTSGPPDDPIGALTWGSSSRFRADVEHLTSAAACVSLRVVEVSRGPVIIRDQSPNEAGTEQERMWGWPAGSAPVRRMPDPDVRVRRDLSQYALVLSRE